MARTESFSDRPSKEEREPSLKFKENEPYVTYGLALLTSQLSSVDDQ